MQTKTNDCKNYEENRRLSTSDAKLITNLSSEKPYIIAIEQRDASIFSIKLYKLKQLSLSEVLPIFENMGLKIISENSYNISQNQNRIIYLSEFLAISPKAQCSDIIKVQNLFLETFTKVCQGLTENDCLNSLTLLEGLNWYEIAVLRAYRKYLQQIRFPFSQEAISESLVRNSNLTKLIFELFGAKFKFELTQKSRNLLCQKLQHCITLKLAQVASINDDQILRQFVALINATVRTNYYLNLGKQPYLSLKIKSSDVPYLPLPIPLFEIFVYAVNFEAIHLRMAKVARGGIRWSDRQEDFRSEILGLMKAQQVKNTVIVPQGAKGGFVLKSSKADGVACYKQFISAMLEITDNIIKNNIINPKGVVCYDELDPYFVVAADKGTAGFSDIANQVSAEHNFWLQDAFASGGSSGYNHKKMGITAKGAFESVKYLFRVAGIDYQNQDFTVVGIGDMSGDVFGNGMLLSNHIKLIGAFNHTHIFIDPKPDSYESFKERLRLFKLKKSQWSDYNRAYISEGGGVFERTTKSIKLSKEIRNLFNLSQNECSPNELIIAMLKAPVDLLWSGGIGTYVKSASEINLEVSDRANDLLRINADELRCKIIGEGANLGLTQKARIQFALNGGLVHTDFIDNSGGVNCSDHEVNIKILLNNLVLKDKLSIKQRDSLLVNMSNEVEKIVLRNNFQQVRAIGLITAKSALELDRFAEIITRWEKKGIINRELESLPSKKTLADRKIAGLGLTRPEIAVMFAYAKLFLKKKILQSNIPEEKAFARYLEKNFPAEIIIKYKKQLLNHKLVREIISTELSSSFINNLGLTFIKEVQEETGAGVKDIVYAYEIAERLFSFEKLVAQIETFDGKIDIIIQNQVMLELIEYMKQTIRWLLTNAKPLNQTETLLKQFAGKVLFIKNNIAKITQFKTKHQKDLDVLLKNNFPQKVANNIGAAKIIPDALNIINAGMHPQKLIWAANIYFDLAEKLNINLLEMLIEQCVVNSHWTPVAKAALKSDLVRLQRLLMNALLADVKINKKDLINIWLQSNTYFHKRWQIIIDEIKISKIVDVSMLYVAIRELIILVETL